MKKRFLFLSVSTLAVFCLISLHPLKAQNAAGSITGKVIYSGTAPKPSLISMAKDPNCLRINAGKKFFQETLLVGQGNSVKNVFVHLKSGLQKKSYTPPSTPAVLDQRGCVYVPRVQGALIGQQLKIINNDQTLHNIHSQSDTYMLNIAQPIPGMVYNLPLKAEEVMLVFRCQVHPWMSGYIGVLPHPFFSVSNDSGSFAIHNVPAGKYVVQAWHEQLGAQTQEVTVPAGGSGNVDFTFSPKKASMNEGFEIREVLL